MDTTVQNCNCCEEETDCINGLCQSCCDYNHKPVKAANSIDKLLEAHVTVSKRFINICNQGGSMQDFIEAGSFRELAQAVCETKQAMAEAKS